MLTLDQSGPRAGGGGLTGWGGESTGAGRWGEPASGGPASTPELCDPPLWSHKAQGPHQLLLAQLCGPGQVPEPLWSQLPVSEAGMMKPHVHGPGMRREGQMVLEDTWPRQFGSPSRTQGLRPAL